MPFCLNTVIQTLTLEAHNAQSCPHFCFLSMMLLLYLIVTRFSYSINPSLVNVITINWCPFPLRKFHFPPTSIYGVRHKFIKEGYDVCKFFVKISEAGLQLVSVMRSRVGLWHWLREIYFLNPLMYSVTLKVYCTTNWRHITITLCI